MPRCGSHLITMKTGKGKDPEVHAYYDGTKKKTVAYARILLSELREADRYSWVAVEGHKVRLVNEEGEEDDEHDA